MSISAPFDSEQEADAAYYASGGGSGDGPGDGPGTTQWGELQAGDTLGNGWSLAYRDAVDGSRTQWFVVRQSSNGTLQFINSAGRAVDVTASDAPLAEQPHFSNEDDARAAYQSWADENGDDSTTDEGGDEWSEWTQLREQNGWFVFTRTHMTDDTAQFLAAGETSDGSTVYLAPQGDVVEEPHIFDSASALTSALEAYAEAAANGSVPEGQQPTGANPGVSGVRQDASAADSGGGGGLLDTVTGNPLVAGAVVVGGYALYRSQKDGNGGS